MDTSRCLCRFEKTLDASPDEVLAHVRRRLVAHGGSLEGDVGSGQLLARTPLGVVRGRYVSSGRSLTILVDEKPTLLPCSAIAAVLDRVLCLQPS